MTQLWTGDRFVGVTVIEAEPCVVVQIKNVKNDGYEAIQLGTGTKKEKNINKPQIGHYKKVAILNKERSTNIKTIREFRVDELKADNTLNIGDIVRVDTFDVGDKVKLVSTSKGKGFQGVVKRYGFKGAKTTHGTKDQVRMPGSVGATGPARIFKGMRMGGRMGGDRVSIANLEVIKVDLKKSLLYIKGGVAGARNALVMIKGDGELKVFSEENSSANEGVQEVTQTVKISDSNEIKNT